MSKKLAYLVKQLEVIQIYLHRYLENEKRANEDPVNMLEEFPFWFNYIHP